MAGPFDTLATQGDAHPVGTTVAPGPGNDPLHFVSAVDTSNNVYVVTQSTGGSSGALIGQTYAANGGQVGAPATLAQSGNWPAGPSSQPPVPSSAAALTNGGWVVAYSGPQGSPPPGVSVIDTSGALVKQFMVGAAYPDSQAAVAALSTGGFVVEWTEPNPNATGATKVETFDAAGNATSGVQVLSNTGAGTPFIASAATGGAYLAGFASDNNGHESIQYFDGTSFKPAFQFATSAFDYTATALADGKFALAWVSQNGSAGYIVASEVYDPATGNVLYDQGIGNVSIANADPHIIATPDGGYVISWRDPTYAAGTDAARAVGADGSRGAIFTVHGDLVGASGATATAVGEDSSGHLIAQEYNINGAAPNSNTYTADDSPNQQLQGGPGPDVFYAGHNSVVMTGNGGADSFVFKALPWNAGQITDFSVGTDRLDLAQLFAASGYTGSDPVADGYVTLTSDGAGGAEVLYDTDGRASGNTIQYRIVDLDHVSPTGLTWAELSGETASGGTGGTGGGDTSGGGSTSGQVLTADTAPDTISGGAGNDTITASQGHDLLTGNGGADSFVFKALPWNAGDISDFTVGTDRLDLSALFQASGYTGSDPIADGYVTLTSDGAGGTEVLYDTDGHGSGNTIQYRITDLDHVSADGLTWGQLSGSASTGGTGGASGGGASSGGSASGQTLTAHQAPDTLTGGAGNDTITASQGHDLLSGGGGADVFVFNQTPWNAGDITDFTPGTDKIDLSGLLRASGYTGSDPFADGYVSLTSDGAGGTEVLYDTDGYGSGNTIQFRITDLDHVLSTQVSSSDFLFH